MTPRSSSPTPASPACVWPTLGTYQQLLLENGLGNAMRNKRESCPLSGASSVGKAACTPPLLAEQAYLHRQVAITAPLQLREKPKGLYSAAWTKHHTNTGCVTTMQKAQPCSTRLLLSKHRVKATAFPQCTSCSLVFAGRSLHNADLHPRERLCCLDHGCHSLSVQQTTGGKAWHSK